MLEKSAKFSLGSAATVEVNIMDPQVSPVTIILFRSEMPSELKMAEMNWFKFTNALARFV